jgi:hypothetical protein
MRRWIESFQAIGRHLNKFSTYHNPALFLIFDGVRKWEVESPKSEVGSQKTEDEHLNPPLLQSGSARPTERRSGGAGTLTLSR